MPGAAPEGAAPVAVARAATAAAGAGVGVGTFAVTDGAAGPAGTGGATVAHEASMRATPPSSAEEPDVDIVIPDNP